MSTAVANCAGSQRRRRREVVGEVVGVRLARGTRAVARLPPVARLAAAASWAAAICRPQSVANPKPTTQAERMCSSSAASSGESPASLKTRSMPAVPSPALGE